MEETGWFILRIIITLSEIICCESAVSQSPQIHNPVSLALERSNINQHSWYGGLLVAFFCQHIAGFGQS